VGGTPVAPHFYNLKYNFMKNILEKATVIDVRTPQEYGEDHYPGAINIPLDEIQQHLQKLKQVEGPIVAYCRSGNRSGVAVSILKQNGINEVYNGGALIDLLQSK
jgi:phage shock protein E